MSVHFSSNPLLTYLEAAATLAHPVVGPRGVSFRDAVGHASGSALHTVGAVYLFLTNPYLREILAANEAVAGEWAPFLQEATSIENFLIRPQITLSFPPDKAQSPEALNAMEKTEIFGFPKNAETFNGSFARVFLAAILRLANYTIEILELGPDDIDKLFGKAIYETEEPTPTRFLIDAQRARSLVGALEKLRALPNLVTDFQGRGIEIMDMDLPCLAKFSPTQLE